MTQATLIRRASALATTLVALLALGGAAWAQAASIDVVVDRTRITTLDELGLQIQINGVFEDWVAPDLSAFEVTNQSVTRMLTGRRSTVTQNYTLRPRRAGTITIPAAQLTRGGQVIAQSKPITVVVTEPRAAPPVTWEQAQDLSAYADELAFVTYATPRPRYYLGEPFPLSGMLYFKLDARVTALELAASAKLDGLLVEEISDPGAQQRSERRRVGGATMNAYTFARQLATPLRPGRVLIDAATVRGALRQGMMGPDRSFVASTQPYWIDILPLPQEGRPPGFRDGNIGRFTLTAAMSDDAGRPPTQVRTGQRLILRVEVSGRGNLITLKAPDVQAGEAFQVEPLPGAGGDDVVEKDERGMHGKRVFQYLVTPLRPGATQTPAVKLSFFDPEAGRYVVAEAQRAPLEVTGDPLVARDDAASTTGEDVRPLIEDAALDGEAPTSLTSSPLYWGLLGLPLLAFLFVEVRYRAARRAAADPLGRRARTAHQNAGKRLKAADQARRDGLVKDFYGQITRTLIGYLEERTNIPATGMTHDQLRAAAEEVGYPSDLVDAVVVEMENCDFARFAPSGSATEKMRETQDRVEALLASLERVSPRRRA